MSESYKLFEGLRVMREIGVKSDRCVYEAESFMCDVAKIATGHYSEAESGWDIETFLAQLKLRFGVEWRP